MFKLNCGEKWKLKKKKKKWNVGQEEEVGLPGIDEKKMADDIYKLSNECCLNQPMRLIFNDLKSSQYSAEASFVICDRLANFWDFLIVK